MGTPILTTAAIISLRTGIAFLAFFFAMSSLAGSYVAVDFMGNEILSSPVAFTKWERYSLAGIDLSVELPGEPKTYNVVLPAQLRNAIRESISYMYQVGEDLLFLVNYFLYKEGIIPDVEGGARGAADNLRSLTGVADVKYTTTRHSSSKTSLNGSFTRYGQVISMNVLAVVHGQKAWVVSAMHRQKSTTGATAAKRIMDSVKIR